jgi:hypothetical protein
MVTALYNFLELAGQAGVQNLHFDLISLIKT